MNSNSVTFFKTTEFEKDLKKLSRKYKTLHEDLDNFKEALIVAHFNQELAPESMGFFPVSHPGIQEGFFIAKKFACKSLKGSGSRSGIRVVYHLEGSSFRVCLIEIFHKNQKAVLDFQRILNCLSEISHL